MTVGQDAVSEREQYERDLAIAQELCACVTERARAMVEFARQAYETSLLLTLAQTEFREHDAYMRKRYRLDSPGGA